MNNNTRGMIAAALVLLFVIFALFIYSGARPSSNPATNAPTAEDTALPANGNNTPSH